MHFEAIGMHIVVVSNQAIAKELMESKECSDRPRLVMCGEMYAFGMKLEMMSHCFNIAWGSINLFLLCLTENFGRHTGVSRTPQCQNLVSNNSILFWKRKLGNSVRL